MTSCLSKVFSVFETGIKIKACKCFCCSKIEVVIADRPSQDQAVNFQELLESNIKVSEDELKSVRSIKIIPTDDPEEQGDQILQKSRNAITDLASSWFKQLCPKFEDQNINFAEGWQRLKIAMDLLNINLQEKHENNSFLVPKEKKAFDECVMIIQKFGTQAALIWEIFKQEKAFDLNALKILKQKRALNFSQTKIFKKILKDSQNGMFFIQEIKKADSFASLPLQYISIFLQAAKKTDEFTHEFVFWSLPIEQARISELTLFASITKANDRAVADDFDESCSSRFQYTMPKIDWSLINKMALDYINQLKMSSADNTESNMALGLFRLQVIAAYLNLDFNVIISKEYVFKKKERKILVDTIFELKKFEGAVAAIFFKLKTTCNAKDQEEQLQEFFHEKAFDKFMKLTRTNRYYFLMNIKKSHSLIMLPPNYLAILLIVAKEFTEKDLETINTDFSLKNWIDETMVKEKKFEEIYDDEV